MIKVGVRSLTGRYVGTREVVRVYRGARLVWERWKALRYPQGEAVAPLANVAYQSGAAVIVPQGEAVTPLANVAYQSGSVVLVPRGEAAAPLVNVAYQSGAVAGFAGEPGGQ